MKVVLLAGGFGTRIAEDNVQRPKPMLEIGGKPILWHIMKEYSYYGFNEFIICAGYMQHVIKDWFADYFLHSSDVTFNYRDGKNEMNVHHSSCEPWEVTIVDTGYNIKYSYQGFYLQQTFYLYYHQYLDLFFAQLYSTLNQYAHLLYCRFQYQ